LWQALDLEKIKLTDNTIDSRQLFSNNRVVNFATSNTSTQKNIKFVLNNYYIEASLVPDWFQNKELKFDPNCVISTKYAQSAECIGALALKIET